MCELWKENIHEISLLCFLEHIGASAQPQLQEEGEGVSMAQQVGVRNHLFVSVYPL